MIKNKKGIIFGIANDHSIAWGIAKKLHENGAKLAITYQNETLFKRVKPLADKVNSELLLECDFSKDNDLEKTINALWELDRLTSAPLYFETAADRKEHIIRNIRSIVERTIDNADFLAGALIDQIYEDTVQLENAISETHASINARFSFWFYSLLESGEPSQEIQTFTEFTQLFIEENMEHAYFLLPFVPR